MSISSQCLSSVAQGREEMVQDAPLLPQRRHLLFYCSYTPQKVIWELYYIGGVFFGASSFGRFGRRGKTPKISTKVSLVTPLASLSVIRNQSVPALLHSSGIVSPVL